MGNQGRMEKRKEEEASATALANRVILNTRVHLIAYFFERVCKSYLLSAKSSPYHPKQQERALLILWLYTNFYKDLPRQPLKELLEFTNLLIATDPTILSLPANQYVLLIINYLYHGSKENLSHLTVMLKAGGKLKVVECLQFMVLAGSSLNMNRDAALLNLYEDLKLNKKDLAMPLGLVLLTAEGSSYQKKSWTSKTFRLNDDYKGNDYHTAIKSCFAPTFHHLKLYLKKLLDSLRGHELMDGFDPYILFPLEEELASSFRSLLRYAPR